MRSRWFHVPTLHCPALGHQKRVSWLELFYDLIFVAAFIQLGNGLSKHVSLGGFAAFGAIFTMMWVAWTGFTFFVNRFSVDDIAHRIIVFVQMFSVGAMAVTASDVLDGEHRLFALSYTVAQGVIAGLYYRTWRQVPEGRTYSRYWGIVFGIAAVVWAASAFVPAPYAYGLWAVALAVVLGAPFSKQSQKLNAEYPWDEEHLTERYGLLTIIVLGESFVKVLGSLGEFGSTTAMFQASATLLITCCLWWIYFDDVGGSKIRRGRISSIIWLYAHIPLQIAITASGVAIKKAVHFDLSDVAVAKYRWLMSGALALTVASVAIIDSVTERRQAELSDRLRVNVRLASAVIILLLAPAGGGMTAVTYLALVTSIMVAQVVFDMMMAPLEASPEHETHEMFADTARRAAAEQESPKRARVALQRAVRKGIPSELRSDAYYYFMSGGWLRFLGSLVVVYVMLNVFFAALYFLQPGCIDGSRPDSFADSFFFSVQTLSTIGFGALSPATEYANTIVTIESAVGMLFVALATGLTFAKVSRPTASVLFSKRMTLASHDGKPTLIFRVGNARGNEIVDASMNVTAIVEEISPEGTHMRRIRDLRLVRERTPLFYLSWSVMHVVDEDSPLYGVDWDQPLDELELMLPGLVVTMIGHDGTYGQTVYARHMYYVDQIDHDHRFVDVIGQMPDGRLLLDYTRFHDTVPIEDKSPDPT